MIRYRDGKIVSTKGERFSQVTKEESEEMKKSYVSWQPAELTNWMKTNPISELIKNEINLIPLWLQDYLYFLYLTNQFCSFFICDFIHLIYHLFFFQLCFHKFYQTCTKINHLIKEKPRWQLFSDIILPLKVYNKIHTFKLNLINQILNALQDIQSVWSWLHTLDCQML